MKSKAVGTLVSSTLMAAAVSAPTIDFSNIPAQSYHFDHHFESKNGMKYITKRPNTIEADVITMEDRLQQIIYDIYGEGFSGYEIEYDPDDEISYVGIFDPSISFANNREKFEALKIKIRSSRIPYTAYIGD